MDPRPTGEEPGPPAAPGAAPAAARRRGRRTWLQRSVIAFNVLLVVVCITTALALSRYHADVTEIDRIQASGTLTQVTEPLEPQNFLLVGVDNAEGLDEDDPVLIGRSRASLLSDTIMLLRVDPNTNRAWLMSFPRDLWVEIASTGSRAKINSALPLGGPEELIETIQQDFEIPVHHYVQVNFQGFKELVDIVDGVPLWFNHPARDTNTGLFVESPGCTVLEGDQALAFVRSRYYQSQLDGRWTFDPTSDHGRILRQQGFVRAALNRAIDQGARNPLELQRMIEAAQGQVILDDELSLRTLIDIGDRFREFDPASLEVLSLPVRGGTAGAASVVYLDEDDAQPVLDVFRGNSVMGNALALVRIEVRNGSGEVGQGRRVSQDLAALGFTVTRAVDASDFRNGRTRILHAPDQLLPAVVLARYLDLDVDVEAADEDLGDAGVVLVTGDDWEGLRDEPRPLEEFTRYLPEDPEGVAGEDPLTALSDADQAEASGDGEGDDDSAAEAESTTTTSSTLPRFVPQTPPGEVCG